MARNKKRYSGKFRPSKKIQRLRSANRRLREQVGKKSRFSKFAWVALGLGLITSPLWFKKVSAFLKDKVFKMVVTTVVK